MKKVINSMTSFFEAIEERKALNKQCLSLGSLAPKKEREMVETMVKQDKKYLKHLKLIKYLNKQEYTKTPMNPTDFIDKNALLKDVQNQEALFDFMK